MTSVRPGRLPPEQMFPAGVSGIDTRYVQVEPGVRLRVLESGDAAGRAVLLVHGWAACAYSFAETIPALAATGFRVLAVELPGFGLSDKPLDDERYSTPALSNAVLKVASAMGLERFSMVGHSLGGALAFEIAIRGERRLDRLVLISPVGLGMARGILPLRWLSPRFVDRVTPALFSRSLVSLVLRAAYGTRGRPTARDIDEYWAPSQFDGYAFACRAALHRANWRPLPALKLRRLRIPVLVISGRRDLLMRGAPRRAKLVPESRMISLREGGHLVHQECAREANAEIVAFLRRRQG